MCKSDFIRKQLNIKEPIDYYNNNDIDFNCDFVGYGELNWENGDKYVGYFLGGTKNFAWYGEYYYNQNHEKSNYKGMWWNDEKNGYGIMTYKNGKTEMGIFKDNKFFKEEKFDLELMIGTCKKF